MKSGLNMLHFGYTSVLPVLTLLMFFPPIKGSEQEGCQDLGPIENGGHNLLPSDGDVDASHIWLPGTVIKYSCNPGFVLNGEEEESHVCTKSGWMPGIKPICERVSCSPIEIEHGDIEMHSLNKFLPGDTLTIKCFDGYQLMMGKTRYQYQGIVCDKKGSWDAYDGTGVLPTCEAIFCGEAPTIDHSSTSVVDPHGNEDDMNRQDARAYYHCDSGFKLKNELANVLKCFNGEWIGEQPVCLEKLVMFDNCPEPGPIKNGYFAVFASPGAQPRLGHSMRAGTKLYYSCQKDFVLEGNSDRTCIGGVWTGQEPKCRSSGCGQPQNIVNGEFRFLGSNDASQEGKVVEGSEVFYFCKSGYRPVDSGQTNAKMTCHDGKWEGAVPECVKRTACDTPQEIPNGNWIIVGLKKSNTKYAIGTKILYECEESFQSYGPTILECQSNGYWSKNSPRCLPQDQYCQEPTDIDNGYFVCKPSPSQCNFYKVSMQIRYGCNSGYELSGSEQLTCLPGGKWSGLRPVCKPAESDAIEEGLVDLNSNTLVIVIATSCSVLGLLLLVMGVVVLQRRKPHPRLCHPAPPPPPPCPHPRMDDMDEHDRVALIAFADGVQVVLPTYEEATRGPSRASMPRFPEPPGRRPGDYRPLPTIPTMLRGSRHDSSPHPARLDNHRSSIVTTTSSTTRDNMSLAFGSIDTMNVSDGTSTTVTIGTYDSASSNPSIANSSQRANAGSLGSANSSGSIATDDAPLIDQSNHSEMNRILREASPPPDDKQD